MLDKWRKKLGSYALRKIIIPQLESLKIRTYKSPTMFSMTFYLRKTTRKYASGLKQTSEFSRVYYNKRFDILLHNNRNTLCVYSQSLYAHLKVILCRWYRWSSQEKIPLIVTRTSNIRHSSSFNADVVLIRLYALYKSFLFPWLKRIYCANNVSFIHFYCKGIWIL